MYGYNTLNYVMINVVLFSGHYVENIGNTTLHFLEIFNTGESDGLIDRGGFTHFNLRSLPRYQSEPSESLVIRDSHDLTIAPNQWLALTPPELVKAHLQISDETLSHFNKTKQVVVGPA